MPPQLFALSQPLAGSAPAALWANLRAAHFRIAPRYAFRFAVVAGTSLVLAPLAWLEQRRYRQRIAAVRPAHDPVFILGHWRTGTTLLHTLMAQDPQWGFLSTFQSFMPRVAILGQRGLKPLLQRTLPRTRPMDDMVLHMDLPQEEEFALGNLLGPSLYTFLYFPARFEHCMTHELAPSHAGWRAAYRGLLDKASWLHGGKPLLLKNPPNTARIPELLAMYPGARFVYLHRDPHEVFLSTVRTLRALMQLMQLHAHDAVQVERHVLALYPRLIGRFLDHQPHIPPERFCCLSYEQLRRDPLGALAFVYARLKLPGFEQAREAFSRHVHGLQGYQPARYAIDDRVRATVTEAWGTVMARHAAWLHTLDAARMGGMPASTPPCEARHED